MLHFLDPFRDFTLASVALRMLLTVLCGGLIGIERAFKRRSAGFRTHILICLGAAMTTMTSLYLVLVMHYYTDLARLGAQVIAGIGFIDHCDQTPPGERAYHGGGPVADGHHWPVLRRGLLRGGHYGHAAGSDRGALVFQAGVSDAGGFERDHAVCGLSGEGKPGCPGALFPDRECAHYGYGNHPKQ